MEVCGQKCTAMLKILLVLLLAGCGLATQVDQCTGRTAKIIKDLNQRVAVGNCQKGPCRLRKDTNVDVVLKFVPDTDITNLKNSVSANILGIPFPFVGVDGEEACKYISKPDGTKVGCNLKSGQEYVYSNKIEVLRIYPKLKTVVQWALVAPDGKDVICFQVPARITD